MDLEFLTVAVALMETLGLAVAYLRKENIIYSEIHIYMKMFLSEMIF